MKRCLWGIFILFFTISFYNTSSAQDECDLSKFVTYTKGGWASDANGNNPGVKRDALFPLAFPEGLTAGTSFTIKLTSSLKTALFLKGGGTPDKLTQSYVDPVTTESGILGIQIVALKLNIAYDAFVTANPVHLTDLVITEGKFAGKTVAEFLIMADAALGGEDISGKGYSYSDLNDAATRINENFDNGNTDKGFLTCPEPEPPQKASIGNWVWVDLNNNGIQDDGSTGAEGIRVELYDCMGSLKEQTTTNSDGYYLFENVQAGRYYVKIYPPDIYSIGKKDQGTDDALDSDVNEETGQTDCFDFAATSDDLTLDAALLPHLDTDLEVIKTASKTSVQCGEAFSYTITVKNLGPISATAVTVKDVLPLEAEYVSSAPSQGSYDPQAGEWMAGSLDKGESASLIINVKANCAEQESKSSSLGAAEGFNVFVFEDMMQPSADTQGKIAVGGNANFANYSVGDLLPPQSGDVLIVGGNLTFISGSINNGNVVYGGTTNLPISAVSITGGTLRHDHPIDFASAKEYLKNLSLELSGTFPNGQTRFMWGSLSLTGNDPILNVFSVSGSDLSAANNFEIDVPKGSSVVVNISGQNVKLSGGMSLLGAAVNNVIFNFFQAQALKITGIDVRGTVLAPLASLDFPSGLISGALIANSVTGSGQFNNDPWDGDIPEDDDTPELKSFTNTASLSGSIPVDNNPENNSSSVTVILGILSGLTESENIPYDFTLRQNYPNPFNPSTTIEFAVPLAGRYSIKVFNMLGQEVTTLLDRDLPSGYHRAVFDASKVPSGIYIYRLSGNNVHIIRKMVLAK